MRNEQLPVYGGFDVNGKLTTDPGAIRESRRPLPIGYWKGAGLSLLLDILAAVLSGGLSVHEITQQSHGNGRVAGVYCHRYKKAGKSFIDSAGGKKHYLQIIINRYPKRIKASAFPVNAYCKPANTNLANGIPVIKEVWEKVLSVVEG